MLYREEKAVYTSVSCPLAVDEKCHNRRVPVSATCSLICHREKMLTKSQFAPVRWGPSFTACTVLKCESFTVENAYVIPSRNKKVDAAERSHMHSTKPRVRRQLIEMLRGQMYRNYFSHLKDMSSNTQCVWVCYEYVHCTYIGM